MTMEERIKRINELYHLSKERALTEEELAEQGILRAEYISAIRNSVKGQLGQIKIVEKDGTVHTPASKKDQKQTLRLAGLEVRRDLAEERRLEAGETLCNEVVRIAGILKAGTVLLYASKEEEVGTDALFEGLRKQGIRCFYPVTEKEDLHFYEAEALEDLKPSTFGVREPQKNPDKRLDFSSASIRNEETVLILVPGILFSEDGYRIGYGKGYYDRFLASVPEGVSIKTVGVCYSELKFRPFGEIGAFPAEKHDKKADFVLFV